MSCMHLDLGGRPAIVCGPDFTDQVVRIGGVGCHRKEWPFDFDWHFGPLWLRKDGKGPLKNQNPPKEVWAAFEVWLAEHDRKVVTP